MSSIFRYLFLLVLPILFVGCNSEVSVSFVEKNLIPKEVTISGVDHFSLSAVDLTSPDPSQDVYITIPYIGDSNNNSITTFYFCSLKQESGCDPLSGESVVLVKNGSNLEGSIDISSSSLSPGDFLKYRMISSDSDGITGGDDHGFILVPYDGSKPRAIRQLGSFGLGTTKLNLSEDDKVEVMTIASDGSTFIGGYTEGALGDVNAGKKDLYIVKISPNGALDISFGNNGVWQLGLINSKGALLKDEIGDMVLDGIGNLYVSGNTESSLGGANAGFNDGFVIKMDASTGLLDRGFGDGDGTDNDGIVQINAVNTADASLPDYIKAMVLDTSGNLYLSGYAWSSLGGAADGNYDGFIIKMDANSGVLDSSFGDGDGTDNDGVVQINAVNTADANSWEYIFAIALDGSGSVYISGHTESSLGGANAGGQDGFVIKMDAISGVLDSSFGDGDGTNNDGIVQINATNTAAANLPENVKAMILDGSGNLYISGYTSSSLGGAGAGNYDGFIIKMDASSGVFDSSFGDGDGTDNDGVVQINAVNTADASLTEYVKAMSLDDNGNIYISGYTSGSLGGTSAGNYDGFIIKMDANSGVLDSSFGDGDGTDNDGVVQINAINSVDASLDDWVNAIALDGSGKIYIAGDTSGSLSGTNAGNTDGFIIKMNASSGVLDSSYGDGDGTDSDGIVQVNAGSTIGSGSSVDVSLSDSIGAMELDGSGNLYLSGFTYGSLGGENSGVIGGFIIKMNASSGVLDSDFGDGDGRDNDGIVQINSMNAPNANSKDYIYAMVLDGVGNIYVSGYTESSLGGANAGNLDGFIIKLDANSGVFDSSFGDGDGSDNDGIVQINAVNTADASLEDRVNSMAFDGSGNLYVSGYTKSSLGGTNAGNTDGFIIKMDAGSGVLDGSFGDGDGTDNDGVVQVNTAGANSWDSVYAMALDDSGNVYLAGDTSGSLGGTSGGSQDGFVIKMDASSGVLNGSFGDGDGTDNDGIVQINIASANSDDYIKAIAIGGSGSVFIAGATRGSLGGVNAGNQDLIIIKLDASSGVLDSDFGDGDGSDNDGIVQINATNTADAGSFDYPQAIALNGGGKAFITGVTQSSLGGVNAGEEDGFVIKLDMTSGLLDNSFGDGDGADNDGIVQLNAQNTEDASSYEAIGAMIIDESGNIFIGGNTQSSLAELNAGGFDVFTAAILSGNDGL